MSLTQLKSDLKKDSDPKLGKLLQRFFKTGKGQYGEGDVFLGIYVPVQREISSKYYNLSLADLTKLLKSKIHEERLCAVLILVKKYERAESSLEEKKIADFYLKNYKGINNWDLVDLSASRILGRYLEDKPRKILYELAVSSNLWKRRIATISTLAFIAQKDFTDTLKICKLLLSYKHDLIHKACGWMLREVGKKDEKVLLKFLDEDFKKMPRTMLRYSIERLSEKKRKFYLMN